jgi:hypothetical protein
MDTRASSVQVSSNDTEVEMKIFLTIAEIEQAINYWRTRERSGEGGALCPKGRLLADIYGQMIYERMQVIDVSRLAPEQIKAVHIALNPRELRCDCMRRDGRRGARAAYMPHRPSLDAGLAIITDISRAPRARIEAPGNPRRQAWDARWRAADCGMTIRYGPVPATGGVVKRPAGA